MMKKRNKVIIWVNLLVLFALLSTCKEYPFASEADCEDCISPKPTEGPLKIELTSGKSENGVAIKIYKGKLEENMILDDSNIEYLDTAYSDTYETYVTLDKYYSVVAEYTIGGKKYSVVDGDKIKLYSIQSTCDEDCWIIRGGKINCRLKF